MSGLRVVGVLALLGATAGPLLDGLHVWSGMTRYAAPQWLGSVWWCPPLFAFAAVAIGGGRLVLERYARGGEAPTARDAALTMAAFVVAYAMSAFLPVSEVTRAMVLLALFVIVWWRFDRSAVALGAAVAAGAGGWLVEHTLVGEGLFFHRDTLLDGVALWIPPLYFLAALAIGTLARRLHRQ